MIAELNGVRLALREAGEGEPLVLVHGSWNDRSTWSGVERRLAERFRVISYDRRGHTDSEPGPPPGTRRDDEDDLAALIEQLCGGRAHVMANSFGGSVSLGLAARRPELFHSLTVHEPPLLALAAGDPDVDAFSAAMPAVVALIESGDHQGAARAFVENVLGPGAWVLLPPRERERTANNAPTFAGEIADPDAWGVDLDSLARGELPILLTHGDQSPPLFAKIVARMAEACDAIEVRAIAGAGHVPHVTHVPECLGLLRRLERVR